VCFVAGGFMRTLVDVYNHHGDQIGCYEIALPEWNEEKAIKVAIDCAIKAGDASEMERKQLVGFARRRKTNRETFVALRD
jgi:hypothetical protein